MISLGFPYAVAGLMFSGFAAWSCARARWLNGLMWALLALSFLAGDWIGDVGNGVLVLALVTVATIGIRRPAPCPALAEARSASAARQGNRLFLPALAVPVITIGGTFLFKAMPSLFDPKQATLIALTVAAIAGLGLATWLFRASALEPLEEGARLMDSVGWAAILPQMLAALGALFAAAGLGETMGSMLGAILPEGSLIAAALVYMGGMALLTMAMGNAFAAFPVMTGAVGLPLLVHVHHGNPAAVAALGMLSGFCGTLLTPMAANFNIVPANLLDLSSRYAVIRAQAPTAILLWIANLLILFLLAFR
ncbi:DUF979 family protein [Sphingomonas sp.]|uniref:5-oxoproline transporter, DUF979 family subunit n=1 Tax=Sphingomonas sp. TaxID=28214 RepID=UPI000DB292F2|nr:DUF979 family protein [Sphingomonas sp.]PZU09037.1 MAG: DUF979 domain-containing protein [Sphingomonas sp.]